MQHLVFFKDMKVEGGYCGNGRGPAGQGRATRGCNVGGWIWSKQIIHVYEKVTMKPIKQLQSKWWLITVAKVWKTVLCIPIQWDCGNSLAGAQKVKHRSVIWSASPHWGVCPRELKRHVHKETCAWRFTEPRFLSLKVHSSTQWNAVLQSKEWPTDTCCAMHRPRNTVLSERSLTKKTMCVYCFVWCYLYETFRIAKCRERQQTGGCQGLQKVEKGQWFSFSADVKVLKLDSDGCTTLNTQNMELQTINRWPSGYINLNIFEWL
jgi:hypothetical protein